MTAKERATFAQIADLARSLQRMREPRERVAISRRLLALAVSLGDTEEKRAAPATPVSRNPYWRSYRPKELETWGTDAGANTWGIVETVAKPTKGEAEER